MTTPVCDEREALFEARMKGVVHAGHAMIGLAIGAKLDLFKAMSEIDQPFTAEELATHSKCKERYIREWLHHMVVIDVADVDKTGTKFSLPEYRLRALTSPDHVISQYTSAVPYVLVSHPDVMECFKEDGPKGISFSKMVPAYEEFARMTSEEDDIKTCIEHILDIIIGIRQELESGITVCDVGSGDGKLIILMASRFPNSKFVGFEVDQDLLRSAQNSAESSRAPNAEFHSQDACDIPVQFTQTFDLVLVRGVFHHLPDPLSCCKQIATCLKPDGHVAIFELYLNSNIYEVHKDPFMKETGQIQFPIGLYFCLATCMEKARTEALGACVGKETVAAIVETAGLVVESWTKVGKTNKGMLLCGRLDDT